MAIPIILLIGIPVLLGIAYVTPFDQPEEIKHEIISEQPDFSAVYFILIGIWTLYLIKILLQIKKKTFKITQRY